MLRDFQYQLVELLLVDARLLLMLVGASVLNFALPQILWLVARYVRKRAGLDVGDEPVATPRPARRKVWRVAAYAASAFAVLSLILLLGAVGYLGAIVAKVAIIAAKLLPEMTEIISSPVALMILGILASLFLFRLRGNNKILYGYLEIIVAVTTMAIVTTLGSGEDFAQAVIAFAGAIYVFVRGLTNVAEGMPDAERERLERWLVGKAPPSSLIAGGPVV